MAGRPEGGPGHGGGGCAGRRGPGFHGRTGACCHRDAFLARARQVSRRLAGRQLLPALRRGPVALPRADAHGLVVEVEEESLAVPDGGVQVAGQDTPGPFRRGPLRQGEERPDSATFEPRPRSDDTIERDELARRLGELVVVDSRLPGRFRGEPNDIDQVPGRIPGARNAPWNDPLPDLPEGELGAYCGSGVTACVVLHRLALEGREGKLYPGSWSEWEQRDLPVETG